MADRKPKKEFVQITHVGLKALLVANDHRADLEPRLDAGAIDGLVADLEALGAAVPAALQSRTVSIAATSGQNDALRAGWDLVSAVRQAVKNRKLPKETKKAYGVGRKLSPRVVKDVKAALGLIADRAEQNPDEARAAGILPTDVTALSAAHDAITSADTNQEEKRAAAPLTTKERNRIAQRIVDVSNAIASAGALHFARNKKKRDEFEALLGQGNPRRRGKKNAGSEREPK